ncbi:MAG TPA: hypothetical protein VFI31_13280 [Pirellulales bacterium]|nr:hypothetical protein [Pirellulales bacterium]
MLHLSMHGCQDGIQLTSQRDQGAIIPWQALGGMLHPLHNALPGGLGVCMSCCGGIHGKAMAQTFDKNRVPFNWLVGSASDADWRDLALAFAVFYRRYQAGLSGTKLIEAVKVASGINDFDIVHGPLTQQSYARESLLAALKSMQKNQPSAPHSTGRPSVQFWPLPTL